MNRKQHLKNNEFDLRKILGKNEHESNFWE